LNIVSDGCIIYDRNNFIVSITKDRTFLITKQIDRQLMILFFFQYKKHLIQNFSKVALPHFQSGTLKTIIDRVLPFEKIAEGHEIMESNTNFGKIIIQMLENEDTTREEL